CSRPSSYSDSALSQEAEITTSASGLDCSDSRRAISWPVVLWKILTSIPVSSVKSAARFSIRVPGPAEETVKGLDVARRGRAKRQTHKTKGFKACMVDS